MDRNRTPRMESTRTPTVRNDAPESLDDDELFELDFGGDDEDLDDDEYGEAPFCPADDPRTDIDRGPTEARALLRTNAC